MDCLSESKNEFNELVRLRRYFHQNPECGPQEQSETLSFISSCLTSLGITHKKIEGGGILGFIPGKSEEPLILLRADTDALPIQEDPENLKGPKACISSRAGVSHACGHDGHMAMLLTEAKILKSHQNELEGSVLLMFEENEECSMCVTRFAEYFQQNKIKIDSCYATHVRWDIPSGKISINNSIAMHGFCIFRISIKGIGGHGSRPDLCNSPIDCFNQFYTKLKDELKMNLTSEDRRFTWSFGLLNAGTTENVIPDTLKSAGTIRFSRPQDGIEAIKKIKSILHEVCEKCGTEYSFSTEQFLPPVINEETCSTLAQTALKNELGPSFLEFHEPWMASETFSFLSSMIPSVFSFTGIRNEETGSGANHHTPKFDIDEKGLIYGTAMALSYVQEFFRKKPDLSAFKKANSSFSEFIKQLNNLEF